MTTFVSFNINGLRARPHQLIAVRDMLGADIIGLQETKVHNEAFPLADVQSLGYHVEFLDKKHIMAWRYYPKMRRSSSKKASHLAIQTRKDA